jgi:hypothetical protein
MDINVNSPSYETRDFDAGDYAAIGLGSFTASSGETFYKKWNDSLFLHLGVTGTVGASTTFIGLTLPAGYTIDQGSIFLPYAVYVLPSGTTTRVPLTPASDKILVRTDDLSALPTGSVSIYVNLEIKISI